METTIDLAKIDDMLARLKQIGTEPVKPAPLGTKAKLAGQDYLFVGRLVGFGAEQIMAIRYWEHRRTNASPVDKSYWEVTTFDFNTNEYVIRRKWGNGPIATIGEFGLNAKLGDYSKMGRWSSYLLAKDAGNKCLDDRSRHGYNLVYSATYADYERGVKPTRKDNQ